MRRVSSSSSRGISGGGFKGISGSSLGRSPKVGHRSYTRPRVRPDLERHLDNKEHTYENEKSEKFAKIAVGLIFIGFIIFFVSVFI